MMMPIALLFLVGLWAGLAECAVSACRKGCRYIMATVSDDFNNGNSASADARAKAQKRRAIDASEDVNITKDIQRADLAETKIKATAKWRYASRACFLLMLTFPFTTRMLLEYMRCRDLGDRNGEPNYLLEADLQIPCYDEAWYS